MDRKLRYWPFDVPSCTSLSQSSAISLSNRKTCSSNHDDDFDTSTDIEASADDVVAMTSTTVTDFEPGGVLGKLLAYVN